MIEVYHHCCFNNVTVCIFEYLNYKTMKRRKTLNRHADLIHGAADLYSCGCLLFCLNPDDVKYINMHGALCFSCYGFILLVCLQHFFLVEHLNVFNNLTLQFSYFVFF